MRPGTICYLFQYRLLLSEPDFGVRYVRYYSGTGPFMVKYNGVHSNRAHNGLEVLTVAASVRRGSAAY